MFIPFVLSITGFLSFEEAAALAGMVDVGVYREQWKCYIHQMCREIRTSSNHLNTRNNNDMVTINTPWCSLRPVSCIHSPLYLISNTKPGMAMNKDKPTIRWVSGNWRAIYLRTSLMQRTPIPPTRILALMPLWRNSLKTFIVSFLFKKLKSLQPG